MGNFLFGNNESLQDESQNDKSFRATSFQDEPHRDSEICVNKLDEPHRDSEICVNKLDEPIMETSSQVDIVPQSENFISNIKRTDPIPTNFIGGVHQLEPIPENFIGGHWCGSTGKKNNNRCYQSIKQGCGIGQCR